MYRGRERLDKEGESGCYWASGYEDAKWDYGVAEEDNGLKEYIKGQNGQKETFPTPPTFTMACSKEKLNMENKINELLYSVKFSTRLKILIFKIFLIASSVFNIPWHLIQCCSHRHNQWMSISNDFLYKGIKT